MGKYKIEIKKSAVKEIEGLPKKDLQSVLQKIAALAENPRGQGCEKLSGQDKYRVRYGDYRIIYAIEDLLLVVYVVKVGHRRDVYR
ncbi:MAG: type II toxin-antitoxin system RelE/ParE family toxin [Candidatus Omnitrophica bacterium]|nr:type II toxin-antitoxin system RelE/ParE family toxin [Candidatus Omnitrophota bacterium]